MKTMITADEITSNHRGYKIHSNILIDELQKRFNNISWYGSSSVSGGVFWLNKDEILKQYMAHRSS